MLLVLVTRFGLLDVIAKDLVAIAPNVAQRTRLVLTDDAVVFARPHLQAVIIA